MKINSSVFICCAVLTECAASQLNLNEQAIPPETETPTGDTAGGSMEFLFEQWKLDGLPLGFRGDEICDKMEISEETKKQFASFRVFIDDEGFFTVAWPYDPIKKKVLDPFYAVDSNEVTSDIQQFSQFGTALIEIPLNFEDPLGDVRFDKLPERKSDEAKWTAEERDAMKKVYELLKGYKLEVSCYYLIKAQLLAQAAERNIDPDHLRQFVRLPLLTYLEKAVDLRKPLFSLTLSEISKLAIDTRLSAGEKMQKSVFDNNYQLRPRNDQLICLEDYRLVYNLKRMCEKIDIPVELYKESDRSSTEPPYKQPAEKFQKAFEAPCEEWGPLERVSVEVEAAKESIKEFLKTLDDNNHDSSSTSYVQASSAASLIYDHMLVQLKQYFPLPKKPENYESYLSVMALPATPKGKIFNDDIRRKAFVRGKSVVEKGVELRASVARHHVDAPIPSPQEFGLLTPNEDVQSTFRRSDSRSSSRSSRSSTRGSARSSRGNSPSSRSRSPLARGSPSIMGQGPASGPPMGGPPPPPPPPMGGPGGPPPPPPPPMGGPGGPPPPPPMGGPGGPPPPPPPPGIGGPKQVNAISVSDMIKRSVESTLKRKEKAKERLKENIVDVTESLELDVAFRILDECGLGNDISQQKEAAVDTGRKRRAIVTDSFAAMKQELEAKLSQRAQAHDDKPKTVEEALEAVKKNGAQRAWKLVKGPADTLTVFAKWMNSLDNNGFKNFRNKIIIDVYNHMARDATTHKEICVGLLEKSLPLYKQIAQETTAEEQLEMTMRDIIKYQSAENFRNRLQSAIITSAKSITVELFSGKSAEPIDPKIIYVMLIMSLDKDRFATSKELLDARILPDYEKYFECYQQLSESWGNGKITLSKEGEEQLRARVVEMFENKAKQEMEVIVDQNINSDESISENLVDNYSNGNRVPRKKSIQSGRISRRSSSRSSSNGRPVSRRDSKKRTSPKNVDHEKLLPKAPTTKKKNRIRSKKHSEDY